MLLLREPTFQVAFARHSFADSSFRLFAGTIASDEILGLLKKLRLWRIEELFILGKAVVYLAQKQRAQQVI